VAETDVKSYYASIDHVLLQEQLSKHLPDKRVWRLTGGKPSGGMFHNMGRAISLGCPLGPLMDAFFLQTLDERIKQLELSHLRYMDDIVVFASGRWKLRKAVWVVNPTLNRLELEKQPEKTSIG
jgi:RNA-directed DNA polymerase